MDVKGMYYNDNLKNIENVWKILPPDFHLIVKEHPSNIGNLKMNFYKKILNLNKVHIINVDVEFNKLVKKSFLEAILLELENIFFKLKAV